MYPQSVEPEELLAGDCPSLERLRLLLSFSGVGLRGLLGGSGSLRGDGRFTLGRGSSLETLDPRREFFQSTGLPASREGAGEGPRTPWFLGRVLARRAGAGRAAGLENDGVLLLKLP